jgi:mRNA interferase RelE/StbE
MAKYRVLIRKRAADELGRIVKRIYSLGEEPRPQGSEKLSARERYRIRQGDCRIVYGIDDGLRTVGIVKIGHRSEVYRV